MRKKVIEFFDKNAFGRFSAVFVGLLLLHYYCLQQPPLWDSVMCIVPAAMTLSNLDYNILALLKMPMYLQDGPNCHPLSVVTWYLSIAVRFLSAKTYIPLLHVSIIAYVAMGISALYSLSRKLLDPFLTWLFCVAVVLFPPFFVQIGEIYLEAPLFASVALSLAAMANGNPLKASAWACVAVLTKETGVVAGAAIGITAFIAQEGSFWQRTLQTLRVALPPAMVAFAVVLLGYVGSVVSPQYPSDLFNIDVLLSLAYGLYQDGFLRYLSNAPDLLFLLVAGLVMSTRLLFHYIRKRPSTPAAIATTLAITVTLSFLGFMYLLMPLVWRFTQPLIRYHLIVFPFVLLLLTKSINLKFGERITTTFLVTIILTWALNNDGKLYPSFIKTYGNDFSIAERSMEYQSLLEVQQRNLEKIQELSKRHQVLTSFFESRYLQYPGNGYVDSLTPQAIRTSKYIAERGGDAFNVSAITECIYLNLLYPWAETSMNQAIVDGAQNSPGYKVNEVWQHKAGVFQAQIFLVTPLGKTCGT